MYDTEEIKQALRGESDASITDIVSLTWHHQLRGWQKRPEVMEERERLMEQWLANRDRDVAARLISLMIANGLKDGALPPDYDPDYTERLCRAAIRAKDETALRRDMAAMGVEDSRSGDLGRSIRL